MSSAPSIRQPAAFKAFLYCLSAYLSAGAVAVATGIATDGRHPVMAAAAADIAATCVVFLFSLASRNSSMYDPYWSLAPLPIAFYFVAASPDGFNVRKVLILLLVAAWSFRLTWNWASGWKGFRHEDWRYVRFRELCGRWYWPVSFLGIHLMPTVCVFLGCLPLYLSLTSPEPFPGPTDFAAAFVTLSAVLIEAGADSELRKFVARRKHGEDILSSGLWKYSRHPNYFGEVLFWWGVFFFSLSSPAVPPWAVSGAAAITALFAFVSIPLTEKRLLARHPGYDRIVKTIPPLVPWFPRRPDR